MLPILIAGGSGTRLWPLSTPHVPKPFADISGGSLFAQTLHRLKALGPPPITLGTKSLEPLVRKHYQEAGLPLENILSEPTGKNTGPAMAFLASYLSMKGWGEKIIGIFPSDHLIKNPESYHEALTAAEAAAQSGALILLGVPPTHPATGFGYIEVKDIRDKHSQPVLSFREKPDKSTAEDFIERRAFFWNSGQFIVKVSTLKNLFETHAPELIKPFEQLKGDLSNLKDIYEKLPTISFDYAVAEKAQDARVLRCDAGWSDLGSWDDLAEQLPGADHVSIESSRNYVFSESQTPIALIGVDNLIVANTKEGLLVVQKGHSQKVKDLPAPTNPQREVRPWGFFEVMSDLGEIKTKIIHVLPGQKLSYQSHKKRDELWVVLEGVATVTLDGQEIQLTKGQSVKILREQKHRMSNNTDQPLRFFELQTGDYFGEDDIERFEDQYGRSPAAPSV